MWKRRATTWLLVQLTRLPILLPPLMLPPLSTSLTMMMTTTTTTRLGAVSQSIASCRRHVLEEPWWLGRGRKRK